MRGYWIIASIVLLAGIVVLIVILRAVNMLSTF